MAAMMLMKHQHSHSYAPIKCNKRKMRIFNAFFIHVCVRVRADLGTWHGGLADPEQLWNQTYD